MLKNKTCVFVGDCMGKPKIVIWLPATKPKSSTTLEDTLIKIKNDADKLEKLLEDCIYDRFIAYAKKEYDITIERVLLREWAFVSDRDFYFGDKDKKHIIYAPQFSEIARRFLAIWQDISGEPQPEPQPALVMNVKKWY